MKVNLKLKYIDQKYEGLEAWVKKGQNDWVRLDFMLEYYLSGNVDLSKQYKGQLRDEKKAKRYYDVLFAKLLQLTSNGNEFDTQKYFIWQKNNKSDINEALRLLHQE